MYRRLEVPEGTVPLALACAELKVSWTQGYRLVLIGQLEGRRVGARWFVTESSLRTLVDKAARGEDVVADQRKWRPRGPDGRYLAQIAKMPGD